MVGNIQGSRVDFDRFQGHDTASTAVCFTLLALAQNPAIQHKVYEELVEVLGPESTDDVTCSQMNDLKYLDIVIKESMRLYSPVPLIARRLDTDCVLGTNNFNCTESFLITTI